MQPGTIWKDMWIWKCIPPEEDKRPLWRLNYDAGEVREVNLYIWLCLELWLAISLVLLLSCSISSGALESHADLLLPCSIISISITLHHHTNNNQYPNPKIN